MKIILEETTDLDQSEVIIRYPAMNHEIERLYHAIQSCTISLTGRKDGNLYRLDIEQILYMESVDDHTFFYCEKAVYESNQKLYELESILRHTAFVRISKSCILNTDVLVHIKPLFDGKFIATLTNGERLTINRHYVKGFKEVLGL